MRRMQSRGLRMQENRRYLVLALMATIVLILLLFVMFRQSAEDARIFDVVLDAGSTGSRIHVFEFKAESEDKLVLLAEYYKRIEPGLSSYADKPEAGAASIKSLLDYGLSHVPETARARTAVSLKATAGLRLLPEAQQHTLLKAVDAVLTRSTLRNLGATMITGSEEGVYAWLTVNYLLGAFEPTPSKEPVVTIDMGGGSTQVVFRAPDGVSEWLPFKHVRLVRFGSKTFYVYQHSYLGLGLNEARESLYTEIESRGGSSSFPCFPKGYAEGTIANTNSTQDFTACVNLLREIVLPKPECQYASCGVFGEPQPAVPQGTNDIYAFSYFYDRLHTRIPAERFPVSRIRELGHSLCTGDGSTSAADTNGTGGRWCGDVAYLYAYLVYGLGIGENVEIQVPNRISGKSVSWSLGASLATLMGMSI